MRLGVSAVQHDMKREETVEEVEKNTELERRTPKRQATGSNPAGGAKNDRCKPFFDGLQRFFVTVFSEHSCRSAGTILYIFRCMPANWLRTIFSALLIKNADLLIRFSRPSFRMGLTPAKKPGCWPVPATYEAVPPGPPNPMWRVPVPLAPPGDEPNAAYAARRNHLDRRN